MYIMMRDIKAIKHQNGKLTASLCIPNEPGARGMPHYKLSLEGMEDVDALESRLSSDPAFRARLIRFDFSTREFLSITHTG